MRDAGTETAHGSGEGQGEKHFSQTEEDQRRDQEGPCAAAGPGGAAPVAGEEVPR